ncbi:MAG: fatty acid desaturase [Sterolibacteriaceae bacterium]|uniref:Fatty acid desaturase n=1 Tax=Candidatus Methylophosphatis roskildensis TaxID=2899263 RepID=A0A9D7E5T3_9PROT|nr:fatty acid desaturase [Candidatus Methylophosphatis roskildensis]
MFSGLFDLPWWGYVVATLVMTHITIASVTIYLHRHQAHRALDLHVIPSHFFRLWLWLTTGMVTKEWAAIHRKHHAKCETPEDPHSPQQLGINRVLWGGVLLYVKESRNAETMERYGHGTPDDWIERHIYTPGQKLGIVVMLAVDILCFGIWPGVLIWGVQMIWIPFWAAGVINGIGHFWGYRNFECADASRNIVPWGILIGGEELHNNHHAFATSAKLSARWYEFDIGWAYICMLAAIGLARVKKVLPKPRFAEAKPVVDLDMLHAVITHRYDVARRYMGSLQSIYREELAKLRGSLDTQQVSALKRWFARDGEVRAQDRASIEAALTQSKRLQTIYAMRRDLTAVWERSNATREQLVRDLQDWCHRAEASGIAQLQEFSLRLRRYAV